MLNKDIILDIKDLAVYFQYEKKILRAVDGVSFQVKSGKTLGLVGESGCGKSVTANTIVKLNPKSAQITKGSIEFHDSDGEKVILSDLKSGSKTMRDIRGKEISMIFQNPLASLNPVKSIGFQVMENLRQHEYLSKKEAEKRVIDLLESLGISDAKERFDEYPHQFSGGMKQRVMIAIAMICNPRLLIADEPTTALDVTIQAQIMELMKNLQKRFGTSIILITHNMGLVADMADDIAVMYMGKIVEKGSKEQVFNEPGHPYTQALLKSVPVLGMGSHKRLEPIRGSTPDLLNMHEGCEFMPRCDYCTEKCKTLPPEINIGNSHFVRCWKEEKINGSK